LDTKLENARPNGSWKDLVSKLYQQSHGQSNQEKPRITPPAKPRITPPAKSRMFEAGQILKHE
jgi:hypothetical protein